MEVLPILKSKNRCLERFLKLSFEFLQEVERSDFTRLQEFHSKRDSIIRALELYDQKITEIAQALQPAVNKNVIATQVEKYLREKDVIIREIIRVDEKIIRRIEQERDRVRGEIKDSKKSKEQVGKFKSSWIKPSGEGLDTKL